ncbi:MAG TPA: sugar transferase [Candidatus Paceibacterota bacterium]|nr:sugar transferase [Candidatus Paceibacterota bacterium]
MAPTEMKAVLICPGEKPKLRFWTGTIPVVLAPFLGRALVDHWLEYLAHRGAKQALILATDRPEQVRRHVGDGRRWGMRVEVVPALKEFSPREAREQYRKSENAGWLPEPDDVILMDRLPGSNSRELLGSGRDWFEGTLEWLESPAYRARLGAREIRPGVWAGLRTQVAPSAELRAPCWLGENVWVGPDTVIGPRSILEDRVVIEAASEITDSLVGPETFVGMLAEVRQSMVWGNRLLNWASESQVRVPDRFILCSLHRSRDRRPAGSYLGRILALIFLILTSPYALWVAWRAWRKKQPFSIPQVAVRPCPAGMSSELNTLVYYEFPHHQGWGRRWPQLWQVVRGEFAWVGNRPLSPGMAAQLSNDFERLWLTAPIGLVSLADAEGCSDAFGDEARAHASYYAVQAGWRMDLWILLRVLARRFRRPPQLADSRPEEAMPLE